MKALVTRPRADAASLAAALEARGFSVLLEPLLAIRLETDAEKILAASLPGAQALLFTSANGARAAASAGAERGLPVFAVGDATAKAARAAGFARVESAQGDLRALVRLVVKRLKPAGGALIHVAASAVAGDLGGDLAQAGFNVRRARLYEAVAAANLSGAARQALAAGAVSHALFFSPRTAATFVRLAREAGLADRLGAVAALGLSPAVIAALEGPAWRSLAAAAAPTETALLAALDRSLGEKTAP